MSESERGAPHRSRGNVRLYSESDIELLKHVLGLMNDLGVNLAGVEVILRMSRQIMELQQVRDSMQQELERLKEQI